MFTLRTDPGSSAGGSWLKRGGECEHTIWTIFRKTARNRQHLALAGGGGGGGRASYISQSNLKHFPYRFKNGLNVFLLQMTLKPCVISQEELIWWWCNNPLIYFNFINASDIWYSQRQMTFCFLCEFSQEMFHVLKIKPCNQRLNNGTLSKVEFNNYLFISRAVQAERLIWSLWCLYVCRDVVLLDNCLTEKSITLLDNCLTEKSITYSHTQRIFF